MEENIHNKDGVISEGPPQNTTQKPNGSSSNGLPSDKGENEKILGDSGRQNQILNNNPS